MKFFCLQVRNMTLVIAVAAAVGLAFMLAAYSLPNEKIFAHVKSSIGIYKKEGDHYVWAPGKFPTDVDNFTNCIMLMEAVYPSERSLLDSALVNRMWGLGERHSPLHTLIESMEQDRRADINDEWKYGRYWHGYLIFLKPLLCVTSVGNIRLLNSYVQLSLIIAAIVLLYRRLGARYVLAFALAIFVINPVTTSLCFQNSNVFYVTLLGVIFLILKNDWLIENSRWFYYFLILGICTVYFDLLTYPLVSFGVPLCLFVVLNKEQFFHLTIKNSAKKIFLCAFSWGYGYVGMWVSKWILATTLTDYNAIMDSFYNALVSKLSSATVTATESAAATTPFDYIKFLFNSTVPQGYVIAHKITVWEVFSRNINALFDTGFSVIFVLFVLYMIFLIIKRKQKPAMNLNIVAVFAFVAVLPFIWYAIIIQHSYIHTFFVYRELAMSIFAIACFLVMLGDDDKNCS